MTTGIAKVNGVEIAWEERGTGIPIVFVSGTGVGGGVWSKWQVPHFSEKYRCITFDLRGTGRSSAPSDGYSVRAFAEDCVALCESLGVEKAHFVGMSLGSAIIQEVAISYPNLVLSATLLSTWSCTRNEPHIKFWFESRLATLQSGDMDLFRKSSFWMFEPSTIEENLDLFNEINSIFKANSTEQPIHAYIGHFMADLGHDSSSRLNQVKCPTLVLYGEEDLITLPKYNLRVSEIIEGSIAISFKDAGHFLWLERGEEVNNVIDEFLTNLNLDMNIGVNK